MDITEIDTVIGNAIKVMEVPEMSNLLFDGKGEIELNRRLSLTLEKGGCPSRVEISIPSAKGSRTHTDVVLFGKNTNSVIACIECKSCITPDVYNRPKPNNNFDRIKVDTEKYSSHNYSPLYIVMWAIHWNTLPHDEVSDFKQFKYYKNHKKMHASGFNLTDLKEALKNTLTQVGLENIIHQSIIGPFDEWRNCKASVIATVSRVF